MSATLTLKKFTSVFLVLVMLFSIIAVSTTSSTAATSGTESKSRVLQVWTNKTGSTPYVTLKQNPAVYQYKNCFGQTKTKNIYKNYLVTVKPVLTVDGGKTNLKSFTKWLDSSSEKITLKKGIYYEITIKASAVPVKLPSINGSYKSNSWWYLSTIKNCGNYK